LESLKPEIQEHAIPEVFLKPDLTERNGTQNGGELGVFMPELTTFDPAVTDPGSISSPLSHHTSGEDMLDFSAVIEKTPGNLKLLIAKDLGVGSQENPDFEGIPLTALDTSFEDDLPTLISGFKLDMIPHCRKGV
jgi:hypothetical protein